MFRFELVYDLLKFITDRRLDPGIAGKMLKVLFENPKMDFDSVLVTLEYKEVSRDEILGKLPYLIKKYQDTRLSGDDAAGYRWIMGCLHKAALGNISLKELSEQIRL